MTRPGKTKRNFIMVRIPEGKFTMGSAPGQGEPDEFPPHEVFLDEYLIGRDLVTAAEWAVFLNNVQDPIPRYFNTSKEATVTIVDDRFRPRKGCSDHPANCVTWFGAQAFCRWLSEKTGKNFHLPTEAQWEKAARGGLVDKRYPWGSETAEGRARFGLVMSSPLHTLSAVGSYPPNPFGLNDMTGNVWEWCHDWYDPEYYGKSPTENPSGPETGQTRVLRGGSWGSLDIQVRCGIRVGELPDVTESRVGFRLARDP